MSPELPSLSAAPPLLLVVSGPSGVGKSVICDRLVDADTTLVHSVSATTRPPRPGETEGEDYFFLNDASFRRGVDAGDFLEWAEVHGHLYGTPRKAVEACMSRGLTPVLNVDVQGGRSVKRLMPKAVLVFLFPPDWPELERRLRGRKTDSNPVIDTRLVNARLEMEEWVHYDYAMVNNQLDTAVAGVAGILTAERASVSRIRKI